MLYVSEAKANDDNLPLQQGSTTTVAVSTLLLNDSGTSLVFNGVVNGSETNCTTSLSGSILTVNSTGLAGETSQFQYKITDIAGGIAFGTVYLSVSQLPAISAYVYENETLFNSKKATFVPPTMKDIFNTWGRFNGNAYWTNGPSATGDAATWILIADENNDGLIDGKSAAFFRLGNGKSAQYDDPHLWRYRR